MAFYMTEKESVDYSHQLAAEWFKDHKAALSSMGDILIIDWRRPTTSIYAVRYLIHGRYIIVTGDLGEAIYAFGSILEIEMLPKFDWHYFIGKCVASETGRQYTMKVPGIKAPVPNCRAIAHYIGLQSAIKQLHA